MISGFFAPNILPQPLIRVAVRAEALRPEWVLVPFSVDTGAALTCIHAVDAIRQFGMTPASLDPTTWPSPTLLGGIGGGLSYMECPASYGFYRDDGEWEIIDRTLRVGELRSQGTPALLGWDLLRHFRLTLHGNSPSVTLERLW